MIEMETWIPILSMVIALVAVIIGPLLSWRHARLIVTSPMRQAWIDGLRKLIAESLGTFHQYRIERQKELGDAARRREVIADAHMRMSFLYWRIKLMLNSEKADHQALMEELMKFALMINDEKMDANQYQETTYQVAALAQKIFEDEGKRVRKGG